MPRNKLSFTNHPRSVGESYGQHFIVAAGFGLRLLWASVACLVHAAFPFLFERTGSNQISILHDRMVSNRSRSCDVNKSPTKFMQAE